MSKAISKVDDLRNSLTNMEGQFKSALPPHIKPEKFLRVIMTAVQQNPNLVEATRPSLFAACMKAAQDGLLADGREGAIVTFNSKSGVMAQWMPMISGIMKKVRNSGDISTWSVQVVKENDDFDYQLGDEEKIIHRPAMSNRGKTIAAYSIVTMKDGEKSREIMSVDDIESVRARSRTGKNGPWVTDFDEMAKKTVARRHSKRLPMSTDIEEFIRQDDNLIDVNNEDQPPPPPKTSRKTSSKLSQAIDVKGEVVTEEEVDRPAIFDGEDNSLDKALDENPEEAL